MMQTIEKLRYLSKFKGDQETLGSIPASLLTEAADEIERLRAALLDARGALYNSFEPGNQSKAWHRANDAYQQSTST